MKIELSPSTPSFPSDLKPEILKTDLDQALDAQIAEVKGKGKVVKARDKQIQLQGELTPEQQAEVDKKLTPKKEVKMAIGKTRKIILMMVYDELTLAEIARYQNIAYETLVIVASSPLFRAELKREMLAKQKLYREGAISELADKVIGKYNEILEKGELQFLDDSGKVVNKVRVNGKDVIDMGKTILEMSGHGQKTEQLVKHDHSSLSDAIVKAHEELEKAEKENTGNGEVIDVEMIESVEITERKMIEDNLDVEDKEQLEWEDPIEDPKDGEENNANPTNN